MYCTWKNTKCKISKTKISTLKNRPINDLGNPLGDVGSFHIIHIGLNVVNNPKHFERCQQSLYWVSLVCKLRIARGSKAVLFQIKNCFKSLLFVRTMILNTELARRWHGMVG